jgi:hypothetical protein
MRNPGGYGQLICEDPKKDFATDRFGNRVAAECDTFTCGHCNVLVFVATKARPEDLGGLCKQCMKLICPHCLGAGNCYPLEKRIAEYEERHRTLKSYGVI